MPLAAGTRVGPFEVLATLGAGGMGVVYRARDTRLGREIALKVLPDEVARDPDRLARFAREARAIAMLSHPNVMAIFEFGEYEGVACVATELLEGEPLRDRLSAGSLPARRAVDFALQTAAGLAAAHDKGIVHRDLKPENLFITSDEQIKILDFGLAGFEQPDPSDPAAPTRSRLTEPGTVMGTAAYMSPEQVRGQSTDHRSDLFSLGVVLFEMLTGRPPFTGSSAIETMSGIMRDEPPALASVEPRAPQAIEPILRRCLEKRPVERFQTARDLAFALKTYGAGADSPGAADRGRAVPAVGKRRLPALAVLPFASIRDDEETRFLGFALADQIISALTYAGGLAVRPSSAVRKYQQQGVDAPTAGRELQVEFVLTGHYLKEADTIRLNVELVAANTNDLVWRETIDVHYENAFELQDIVSEKVLRGLNLSFSRDDDDRRAADAPGDPQAYEYYLRAIAYPITLEGSRLAIKMLDVAIARDAGFAPAHAELGFRLNKVAVEAMQGRPGLRKVEDALKTALSLNDRFLPALWHLAMLYVDSGRTHDALALIERLFRVAPGTALPHFVLAYLLRYAGLLEESAREIGKALDLDPGNPRFRSAGFTYLYLGDYQRAYEVFDLDRDGSVSIALRGISLLLMGDNARAREHFDRVVAMEPESFVGRRIAVLRAIVLDQPEEAGRLMRALESASANESDAEHWYLMAEVYGLLGEAEPSARLLEKAVNSGFFSYQAMLTNPFLDAVRDQEDVQQALGHARRKHEEFKAHLFERWKGVLPLTGA